jgi:hypothetical protein
MALDLEVTAMPDGKADLSQCTKKTTVKNLTGPQGWERHNANQNTSKHLRVSKAA